MSAKIKTLSVLLLLVSLQYTIQAQIHRYAIRTTTTGVPDRPPRSTSVRNLKIGFQYIKNGDFEWLSLSPMKTPQERVIYKKPINVRIRGFYAAGGTSSLKEEVESDSYAWDHGSGVINAELKSTFWDIKAAITIDDPIEITDAVFLKLSGGVSDDPYACYHKDLKIRLTTLAYLPNSENKVYVQVRDRDGNWQNIKTGLNKKGGNTDLNVSGILTHVDFGKPIVLRTVKIQPNNKESYSYDSPVLFCFPKFELPSDVIIELPNCKGKTPTIKIPYNIHSDYIVTLSQTNGINYNFRSKDLPTENGYYIINDTTRYYNDKCTNCLPSISDGETYTLYVEHANAGAFAENNITPCYDQSEFTIPSMPNLLISALNTPSQTDNRGNTVNISTRGNQGSYSYTVTGSRYPQVQAYYGSTSKTVNLTSQAGNPGYYSGTVTGTSKAVSNIPVYLNTNGCFSNIRYLTLIEPAPISYGHTLTNADCDHSAKGGKKTASAEITNITGGFGDLIFTPSAQNAGAAYRMSEIEILNGEATFSVGDVNNNQTTTTESLAPIVPVTISTEETAPSMYCADDGLVSIANTLGGQAPYTYSRINETAQYSEDTAVSGYREGVHTIYVQDAKSCIYEHAVNIPEAPEPLQITNETTVLPRCYQQNNGSYTFEVNRFLGDIAATSQDVRIQQSDIAVDGKFITISNRNAGIYPITISDTYNGKVCDTTIYFEIPEKEPLSITAEVSPVIGKGTATGQINLEIKGGNTGTRTIYLYDGSNLQDSLVTSENQAVFANLRGLYENGGKNYSIEIKDGQNCLYSLDNGAMFPFKMQEPEDSLKIQLELVAGITCNGESDAQVRAVPSGGWGNYQYSHGNKANFQTNDLYTQLSAKKHTFYLTDSMGALDSTRIEVLMPDVITSGIAGIDSVKCHGTATGTVNFTIQGGVAPFRHSILSAPNWMNGEISEQLAEGTYSFVFTDANNCTGQDTVSVYVPEPDTLDFKQIEVTQTTCNQNNGKIALELTGGTKPYTYNWTNFSGEPVGNTAILDNLSQSGYYYLAVKDKNGCTQSYEQAINPSNSPKIDSLSIEHLKCFGDQDGAAKVIAITAPEPFAPYTLSWSDGTQESYSTGGLEAGMHYVRVSDTNNCIYTEYFEVSSPEKLNIALTDSKAPHCNNYADAYLEIQPTGGFGAYRYAWSNGASTQRAEELESGTYTVTLTDENNCSISETFSISNPEPVALDLGKDIVICPGNGYVLDGFDYAAYKWGYANEELSSEQYIYADKSGDYYLTVTDSVGCFGYDTINVAIGNHALKAEFLLSNHSYRGDTLRLVELSNMPLDSLSWEYNPAIFEDVTANTDEEFDLLLETLQLGMYNIQLYAWSGGCFSTRIKDVEIMERTDSTDTYDFLGYTDPLITSFQVSPNPNNGLFNVSVTLREPADIRLTVFSINKGLVEDEQRAYGLDNYTIAYSLESLYTGTYVIILTANNERRQVKMIIDK